MPILLVLKKHKAVLQMELIASRESCPDDAPEIANSMNHFDKLSDDEVFELAQQWRREALRGDRDARGRAHEYEVEHRRRSGKTLREPAVLRVSAPLGELPLTSTWRQRWGRYFGGREFA